jgi:DEAD/DEAH box helicase domain-containing protein
MNYIVFDIETTTEIRNPDLSDLEIAVVSVYEKNTDVTKSFLADQFTEMWPIFERADALVGYNSNHFDIRLLNRFYNGDLTNIKSIDLLDHIKDSFGKKPKLDSVAEATLGKKKIGHGLDAIEWWKQGRVNDVVKYCEEDVKITKELFEYILDNKSVKLKEKITGKILEIEIDTTDWLKKEENAKLTKTLF